MDDAAQASKKEAFDTRWVTRTWVCGNGIPFHHRHPPLCLSRTVMSADVRGAAPIATAGPLQPHQPPHAVAKPNSARSGAGRPGGPDPVAPLCRVIPPRLPTSYVSSHPRVGFYAEVLSERQKRMLALDRGDAVSSLPTTTKPPPQPGGGSRQLRRASPTNGRRLRNDDDRAPPPPRPWKDVAATDYLPSYNSLLDKCLATYYGEARRRQRLMDDGIVTPDGRIVRFERQYGRVVVALQELGAEERDEERHKRDTAMLEEQLTRLNQVESKKRKVYAQVRAARDQKASVRRQIVVDTDDDHNGGRGDATCRGAAHQRDAVTGGGSTCKSSSSRTSPRDATTPKRCNSSDATTHNNSPTRVAATHEGAARVPAKVQPRRVPSSSSSSSPSSSSSSSSASYSPASTCSSAPPSP